MNIKRITVKYLGGGRFKVVQYAPDPIINGYITDFASIPRLLTPIFPILSDSIIPSIIHDYNYSFGHRNGVGRKRADNTYYDNLLCFGIPKYKAKLMYWGVRLFGKKYYKAHD